MTSDSALSPNPTRETKADLRRRFPKLLLDAASNAEARSAALRAALKIGVNVPADLLEPGNVAASLQPREIARSLRRLSTSTLTVDVSGALDAIRVSAAPRLSRDFRLARDLTRTVTKQLLEQRTAAGFLKLLYPDRAPDTIRREELGPIIEMAVEMRRRVTDQLGVISPAEFKEVAYTFRAKES
ncbi:MAG: hypothetical protein HYS14_06515 [Candidatus Rokubacteria bacterium]|nr:hypothetical protein [Candidatus Rokubacteria bacterium]